MKRLLFVLIIFLSANCYAETYKWGQAPGYDSPLSACEAQKGSNTNVYVVRVSDTYFECWGTLPSGYTLNFGGVARSGDSCLDPAAIYNSATGRCDVPAGNDGELCGNTTWQSSEPFIWSHGECVSVYRAPNDIECKAFSMRDGGATANMSVHLDTPQSGPINQQSVAMPNLGCTVEVTSSQCTVNADGKSSECLVSGKYTGGLGNGGQDPKAQDCHTLGGCEAPDLSPKTDTNNEPCNYTTGADGSLSCTSKQETNTSGSQNCGTFNGTFSCDWNAPTSKDIDISTKIDTTSNPDGSTTTVKTDVSTKTVCTDMNVCSTVTTTTKTTTNKDGSGTVTSSSSSCTGNGCGTGSATNGTGSGSGNGTGEGGGNCVTAEECSDGSGPSTPMMDDVDDYQTTTQKFYDKVKVSPLATSVNAIAVPDNGAAPNFHTDSIAFLGGISLDFSVIGTLWSTVAGVLSAVMKAFWCFVAVCIFLMA